MSYYFDFPAKYLRILNVYIKLLEKFLSFY